MMIPEMLKNRWARATCMAVALLETSAARMPVTVVPMLAPSVIGNMTSRLMMSRPAAMS